jgi:peptidoglycan hydrolase CwlO-like protein
MGRPTVSMPLRHRHPWVLRAAAAVGALGATAAVLAGGSAPSGAASLQDQIQSAQNAKASLQSAIAADSTKIRQTTGGIESAQARLTALQSDLARREAQLATVQTKLLDARTHLLELENLLRRAAHALAANLVANYEGAAPNLVSVVLEAHGFSDLLERLSFLRTIGNHDAQIVDTTRLAHEEVAREADALGQLEQRDQRLTAVVLAQRNQVAALQDALLRERIRELGSRANNASKLTTLNADLSSLEKKAAAQAAAAAATGNAGVGGIAVNTGGMVQPPPGAPPAVARVIAAGNAIATLPYIWGGGHGSFQANGYDCSGSVSYALAAAGLVSAPMVSGDFESWGLPGPGRWITVYANAGHVWMQVAGWRFDTVALATGGTRWAQGGGEFSGFVVRHPAGL